jgi:hypothetical protein
MKEDAPMVWIVGLGAVLVGLYFYLKNTSSNAAVPAAPSGTIPTTSPALPTSVPGPATALQPSQTPVALPPQIPPTQVIVDDAGNVYAYVPGSVPVLLPSQIPANSNTVYVGAQTAQRPSGYVTSAAPITTLGRGER